MSTISSEDREDSSSRVVYFWGEYRDFLTIRELLLNEEPYSLRSVNSHEDLFDVVTNKGQQVILVTFKQMVSLFREPHLSSRLMKNQASSVAYIALVKDEEEEEITPLLHQTIFDYLEKPIKKQRLLASLKNAFAQLELREQVSSLEEQIQQASSELHVLNEIGAALSSERETGRLMEMILDHARELTRADSGSIYIVEIPEQEYYDKEEEDTSQKKLRFAFTQSDTLQLPFRGFVMDINEKTISGYVALTGTILNLPDAYNLSPDSPFSYNTGFDKSVGYRSKSMLVVPMKNKQGDMIGVLQLINKKIHRGKILTPAEKVAEEVVPFTERDNALILALAGQAAVALENSLLYEDIQRLFQGFVHASVKAIESRDPVTSGHSNRVAVYTVGLAKQVDRIETGIYKDIRFTREQIREIEYASLLHDFGKVGVREHVLVKPMKLYDWNLELIKHRFAFIKRTLEVEHYKNRIAYLLERSREDYLFQQEKFEASLKDQLAEIDEMLTFLIQTNMPAILPEEGSKRLQEIAQQTYLDLNGNSQVFLDPHEVVNLSIRKGSLNEEERREIESHATHTFLFLRQIPWTKGMRGIPNIAYGHHEKLNGEGYPRGIKASEIPIQTRIMTISDIFDALTAADRPYKKALPKERALDILGYEVKDNHIDPDLVNLFIEAKIYDLTNKEP